MVRKEMPSTPYDERLGQQMMTIEEVARLLNVHTTPYDSGTKGVCSRLTGLDPGETGGLRRRMYLSSSSVAPMEPTAPVSLLPSKLYKHSGRRGEGGDERV